MLVGRTTHERAPAVEGRAVQDALEYGQYPRDREVKATPRRRGNLHGNWLYDYLADEKEPP